MKKIGTLLIALSIMIIMSIAFAIPTESGKNSTTEEEIVVEEEPSIKVEESPKEEPIKIEPPKEEKSSPKPAPAPKLKPYSIPNVNTSFKSWMPYTAITNRTSAAYKQQQRAYTDDNGLRKINNDYCVAMGTFYSSTIGERFKVTMSTGRTFTIIISDIKSDRHTDSTHRYTAHNGCMMEFLIDRSALNSKIRSSGSVGSLELFSGQFAKIEKIL